MKRTWSRHLALNPHRIDPQRDGQRLLRWCLIAGFAVAGLSPVQALAATIVVDSTASGLFGTYASSPGNGIDLIEGLVLGSGEQVELSATGSVFLGTTALPSPGPDGAGPFDRASLLAGGYLPLEEDLVDTGGSLPASFDDIGALFAAFVPEATAASGGFLARNVDQGGAIPSDALFLVGAGPFVFTAPEVGRLYFGVNDSLGANNTGSFTVTTAAVPEPATALLLAAGLAGLITRRRPCQPW